MKHPCHKNQIASLRRIKGQIEGVERMIEDGKYCVDILNQIKATKNAISTVEGKVLRTHLQECIKESFNGNGDSENKIVPFGQHRVPQVRRPDGSLHGC